MDGQLRQLASFVASGTATAAAAAASPSRSSLRPSSSSSSSSGLGRAVGFHYLVVKESLRENPVIGQDGLAKLDLFFSN